MKLPTVIAIDGPAASGKSTVGQEVAKRLGYKFLDTGVMYRVVTWQAIEKGINLKNRNDVTQLAKKIQISQHSASVNDGRMYDVFANGIDITWNIILPIVNDNVSLISTYPGVRKAMTANQRRLGSKGMIVMVGRDIGTVVMPKAELKIFLEASVEERARRRFKDEVTRGSRVTYNEILESMLNRDLIDSNRSLAPLKPAKDAIIINTNGKGKSQVIEEIMALVRHQDNLGQDDE